MDENVIEIDFSNEAAEERYLLALERVSGFPGSLRGAAADYFTVLRDLALLCDRERRERKRDAAVNRRLFSDVEEENYSRSFLDPDYAAARLGKAGQLLCVWYAEFRGIIPFTFENRLMDCAVLLETTIQLFNCLEECGERLEAGTAENPAESCTDSAAEALKDILYEYLYDYAKEHMEAGIRASLDPDNTFALDIIKNADLSDTGEHSYLYSFGERITQEQLLMARTLDGFPEETIEKMASAYTRGFIKGFAATGKDISIKSTVSCYMPLGLERMMRAAVRQFEEAGLKVVLSRSPHRLISRRAVNVRPGFYGALNSQYELDHKEDMALFWGSKLKSRKLQALRHAYEENRELAAMYAGPACIEAFGKKGSEPEVKTTCCSFTKHQHKVTAEYQFKAHEIAKNYIPDEETSFTIIAWPLPSVAGSRENFPDGEAFLERYREIFGRIIEINTLPVEKWQQIQQCLADALDRAEYVEVRGCGASATDIRVAMHKLSDPEKESNFENCLADVNVPAGEVFTSPVLAGTDGMINPDQVYIQGYLFRDLRIVFRSGRVADYSCGNFEDPEKGRELIRKIIFRNREELPLGEFAIGTNTLAYAVAEHYGIGDKLPILIAEKTGPHFAVGDTCYSYEEDIMTCNPDGKRLTARENECSALRNTDPEKAYFNVHTDITLPYDTIGSITAVSAAERVPIIENGRFVLPGTEELNEAFDTI